MDQSSLKIRAARIVAAETESTAAATAAYQILKLRRPFKKSEDLAGDKSEIAVYREKARQARHRLEQVANEILYGKS